MIDSNNFAKDQAIQIQHKKCGTLSSILIKELAENEVIHSIYLASSKLQSRDGKKDQQPSGAASASGQHQECRFILAATLSCQVYLINLLTQESHYKFDLSAYRNVVVHGRQYERYNGANAFTQALQHNYLIDMMQPYMQGPIPL